MLLAKLVESDCSVNIQSDAPWQAFADWLNGLIGERVHRLGREVTLREIARAGRSASGLGQLRKGHTQPDVETCLKLALFFEVDPEEPLRLGGHENIIPAVRQIWSTESPRDMANAIITAGERATFMSPAGRRLLRATVEEEYRHWQEGGPEAEG